MKCLFLFINLLNFIPLFTLSNKLEKECVYEDVIAVNNYSYVGVYKKDSELVIKVKIGIMIYQILLAKSLSTI